MAIDINFGALQSANPFAAYQQGQEVAQKRQQDQARQQAGNVFASDPDKAAQILASSGDLSGAAEVQKIGTARKAATSRIKAAQLYSAGNVKGAENEALSSGDSEFLTSIKGLSDQDKEAAKERAQNIAAVGYGLSKLPYEERKAKLADIAQHPEMATALGLKPEDLANYDPTNDNINASVGHALGLAKQIEQANNERDFGLKQDQFGETKRHNQAGETNAAGQLAISRGQLGVAQGNLSLRGAEFRQKQSDGAAVSGKPMSAAAQNLQATHLDAIQTTSGINERLQGVVDQIDSGALKLGPVSNIFSGAKNAMGQSDQNSRNYASFSANLEKLRNDSLRLNKGVQTEGDAQRAWNELVKHKSDPAVVKQRLQEIEGYNRQALAYHADVVSQIRQDSRQAPIDTSKFLAQPQSGGGAGAKGGNAVDPAIQQARDAISRGAPRDAVIKRLREHGINPAGL